MFHVEKLLNNRYLSGIHNIPIEKKINDALTVTLESRILLLLKHTHPKTKLEIIHVGTCLQIIAYIIGRYAFENDIHCIVFFFRAVVHTRHVDVYNSCIMYKMHFVWAIANHRPSTIE